MIKQKIIDTHTHLCDPVFDKDRAEVIQRAREVGVAAIVLVSEVLADARKNLELAATYPGLLPAAGLYPTHLDIQLAEEMCGFIRTKRSLFFAVGEVGLDYWAVKEELQREVQRQIFKSFIDLSLELKLPLNVHSRSAGRHAIALLLEQGARKVQLHAFDGKAATALQAAEAGFFFSIPPSVVRSRQKQKLVKRLPLSCLLIETDCPVLGPSPQERNQPSNAVIAVDAISEIKGISRAEVAEAAYQNTLRLYGDLRSYLKNAYDF
jgi:TatD DNase family protein